MLRGLVAIARKTNLTAEQLANGYRNGWNDIVYNAGTGKEEVGSWWRDEETAGMVAVERIKDIQMSAIWNNKPVPKANWDYAT